MEKENKLIELRPDPEYAGRLDAERVTLQFGQKSARPLDAGKRPIAEAPLFGGAAQSDLFGGAK